MNESTCKSCGANIIWARTINGASMPLDVEPVDGGNIDLGVDGIAYVRGKDTPSGKRYRSHFASCVNAASHRRKKT